MAFLDLGAMNAALKELYDGQVVENLVYADNPFFAMLPKSTDFGGKYKPIPIITGVSQGTSSTFVNAQGNQTTVEVESFLLTRSKQYALATIDNETMLASQTDKMSFLNGSKLMIDGAIRSGSNAIASSIFRSGTGTLGQIASYSLSVLTATIVLTNPNDIVQFERGMTLIATTTDGGASSVDSAQIQTVNRSTGSMTILFAGAPSVTWAVNSFLVVQGDLNQKAKGLAAWMPSGNIAPGDNFFGVDRSVDRNRLGGNYYDGSAQSIEEALIDASSLVAREGGRVDVGMTNFASYSSLEKALGSKVQYIDMKQGEIGFRGIMVNGAASTIKILADRNCQSRKLWLLQMNTWKLEGLGDVPQILKYGDGLEMLRVNNADAGEVRIGAYFQLRTNAPGWNANVDLSS
jgi:hypothetical protein